MAGPEVFANQPQTVIVSGGTTAPAGGTQESWTPLTPGPFPVADPTASPATFFRVCDPAQQTEKILVTDSRTTPWTVTRGAEGTTPVAHSGSGFTVEQVITAGTMAGLVQSSNAALTGTPTAPTATAGTNTTQIATTAFVETAVGAGGGGGTVLTRTAVQTSNYTAGANQVVPVDTTSGPVTVTAPNAPAAGTLLVIKQVIQGNANAVTVACAGSDVFNKAGGSVSGTLALLSQGMFLHYNGAGIWTVLSDDLALGQLDARYAAFAGDIAGGVATVPRVQMSDLSGGAWGLGVSDSSGHLMSVMLVQDQSGNPLQDQSGQPLGMPDTLTIGTPSKPYGLAIGQGGCTVPVGLSGHYDDDLQMSSDTSTSMSYRQFWPLADPQCGAVLPVFAWPLGNPSDQDGTGTLTVACSVECDDGTVLPFYFSGSRTFSLTAQDGRLVTADYPIAFGRQATGAGVNGFGTLSGVWLRVYASQAASRSDSVTTTNGSPTVADASILATDLFRLVTGTGIPAGCRVGSPLTPGTSFTLVTPGPSGVGYTNVNATASGTVTADISNIIPLNIGAGFVAGSLWNGPNGADLTPQGTVFSGNSSFAGIYGPVLLLGRPSARRVPIVAQISDSIFNGTTDAFLGPVQRASINLGYPLVKLSRFSAYAADWSVMAGSRYRRKLVPGCTHAIVELGTNDGLQNPANVTGLKAAFTALGAWLSGLGVKAWLCTVCPRTNSTDNWATLGNQTILYPAANLAAFNNWVRSVPPGWTGYVELGNLVSSSPDSGLWAVNGTPNYAAADGTHPSSTMMTGPIAAAVQSVMSTWTVV